MRAIPSALAALLFAIAPAWAQSSRPARGDADFDYFLLSLSVAPSFCATSSRNAATSECRDLTEAEFQQTPLTIHGLWPNRARVSTNRQPRDCNGPPFALSGAVAAQLRRLMPGGPGLARYEWRKHGTCSGLDPDRYFAAEAMLAQSANETIGAAMLQQGASVRIAELLQTVAASDPALAAAIVVDCRFSRGGGDALVQEIRVTLGKDLRPIPAASVGLGQNSGCPAGAGHIPAVSR